MTIDWQIQQFSTSHTNYEHDTFCWRTRNLSPLQDDSSLYSSGHKIVSFTARSHFGFHVLLDDYYPNSFDPPAELGDRIEILTSQSAD